MKQPKTQEEKKEEMKRAYDTAVSKHEEYKEIWKSFPVTPEGEQEKKVFSIRTGYSPSQRPKTPAMKAFEELRGIWTVYGEWSDSMEEKRCRETILLSPDGPEWAFHASVLDGQAWPEAESIIATDAWWAFEYAQDVVGSGNATIERGIMDDAYYTYLYARFVVKGRFERGEEVISQDPRASLFYAQKVLARRFVKGEAVIFATEFAAGVPPSSASTAVEYRHWCQTIGAPLGNSSSTVGAGDRQ